jgi:hypothetical protein
MQADRFSRKGAGPMKERLQQLLFAATVTLSAPADRATQRKLLKRTHKIIGPPPDTLAETRPELAQCEDLVT